MACYLRRETCAVSLLLWSRRLNVRLLDDNQLVCADQSDKSMEKRRMSRLSDRLALLAPPGSTVAVAINGKKKSKYIVFWALEKFVPEGITDFKLIYVRPPTTYIPTPMGAAMHISEVRDDVASAYRKEVEWQTNDMLRPYKKMCEFRKVRAEVLIHESDDVAAAIAEEVIRQAVYKLVIGVSSRGYFSRKHDLSSMIAAVTPTFCTVYVISKGKLASVRPSDSATHATVRDDGTENSSTSGSSGPNAVSQAEYQDLASFIASEAQSGALLLPTQMLRSFPPMDNAIIPMDTSFDEIDCSRGMNLDMDLSSPNLKGSESGQGVYWTSRWRDSEERREARSSSSSNQVAMVTDNHSHTSNQGSNVSDRLSDCSATESQVNLNFEIEKLRAELKNVQEMYSVAQTETIDASRKLNELNQRRFEEAVRLEELRMKEEHAKEQALKEKLKYDEAIREAETVRECVAKETLQRKEAERKAARDAKDKAKLEICLTSPPVQYQHYSWEEIEVATSSFSGDLKVGTGAYGTVYKCNLHHTAAAVKVLHSGETKLSKQFQQELDILSNIRHPHLLLLLGACPERGCLVYEYMENGSLDDRLMLVNNTPPIPWHDRFRIAWEVASALLFLHKSRPKPIIHRDLKPANILLDHNFVSKLGDVGLSTMVQADPSSKVTIYKTTSPVGTLCYIDPEYQRTGMISAKSDVYSLGVVILQLVTGKPAIALTHMMEEAIGDDGEFMEMLDAKAGAWPINETRELAALGLCCTELRRRDRPDLRDQILPTLERLRKFADRAHSSFSTAPSGPPSLFICPLLKDVMKEPCVAADGYTYDREAIEEWFKENDVSPMTKLPLPNKNLLPNYTLYTAIMELNSNNLHRPPAPGS